MSAIKPIPEGYHSVQPYLIVKDAAKAIEFYKEAFGAIERVRMPDPKNGKVGHAELQIGDSIVMLADEFPEMGHHAPTGEPGEAFSLVLYVPDVDATVAKAVAMGATVKRAVEDKFYGDRMGSIADPFGYLWSVGTHKEDVTPEEMKKRLADGDKG